MSDTTTKNLWEEVCRLLALPDAPLSAVHIQEIEQEAENVLDLLTVLRTDAYRTDAAGAQETAAELTIALEHLQSHIQMLLPILQKKLDLEP